MKTEELKAELIKSNLISWAISEMNEFLLLIKSFDGSDERSYSKSFESLRSLWYDWIHLKLDEYDFVNGKPEENTWEKRPKACFWWEIYQRDPAYYPPYYDHHCSSNHRQIQMINLIEDLIKLLKEELL